MKKLIVAVILVAASASAFTQTFEQSIQAYERKDYVTALAGFKKLAEQGNASAQSNLGMMYANGQGAPKDEQLAVNWFRKAAEQGVAIAQFNLGLMYANGQGVPKDEELAYFWWLLSSARGNKSGIRNRDIIEQALTPQQRASAQLAARTWKPK